MKSEFINERKDKKPFSGNKRKHYNVDGLRVRKNGWKQYNRNEERITRRDWENDRDDRD